MKSLNRIQLVGWLGNDPEFVTLKDGTQMARMRLATDIFIPQQQGPPKKITSWHTVKLWSQAHVKRIKDYLIKGSHILVEGRLEYRTYEDKTGHTRYVTEINASYFVDLDR